MIYLDYSATTPMSESAIQTFQEVSRKAFGNPSSLHDTGTQADHLVQHCRKVMATCIEGDAQGIYFTGSGSEANDLAIRSLVRAHKHKGKHLITTKLEHSSVLNTFYQLEKEGFEVTFLSVDSSGLFCIESLQSALRPDTILASIHHASSEIGTIQPLEEIARILRKHHVLLHVDAVQSFGKIPVSARSWGIDSLSLSAHKIYGPKGVGAVYIRPDVSWRSVIEHTTHEKGFRPGTLNVPGIAAFATAAQECMERMEEEAERCRQLTTQLLKGLQKLGKVYLVGHPEKRLPHHLGLRMDGIEGQYVLLECNRHQIAVSTGSACLAHHQGASEALEAIGLDKREADEFFRITIGRQTTEKEILQALHAFSTIMTQYAIQKGGC